MSDIKNIKRINTNKRYRYYDPDVGIDVSVFILSIQKGIAHVVVGTKRMKAPIDKIRYKLYDEDGYNVEGYNIRGYDKRGYDKQGYNINGIDKNGKDRKGQSVCMFGSCQASCYAGRETTHQKVLNKK